MTENERLERINKLIKDSFTAIFKASTSGSSEEERYMKDAQSTIHDAMSLVREGDSDYGDVYYCAAMTCNGRDEGSFRTGISYIDRAIKSNPEEAKYYHQKAELLRSKLSRIKSPCDSEYLNVTVQNNPGAYPEYVTTVSQFRGVLFTLVEKAQQVSDGDQLIYAHNWLSILYYMFYPINETKAVEHAEIAAQIMKQKAGPHWRNEYRNYKSIILVKDKDTDSLQQQNNIPQSSPSSGGCYVATAVYGSYDCPQVWTLRRYRDDSLAKTWYGRFFIRVYYSVSPTVVRLFGQTDWFNRFWKNKLDRFVDRLRTEGFDDTPYCDK